MAELTALQAEVVARIRAANQARRDSTPSARAARWAHENNATVLQASNRFGLSYQQIWHHYHRRRPMPEREAFETP